MIILILILLSNNLYSQDFLYIPKEMTLANHFNEVFDNNTINNIDTENYRFNGYLVINLDYKNDSSEVLYYAKIYWVESLNDIPDINKHIWYFPHLGTII